MSGWIRVKSWLSDETGVVTIEYAFTAALIAVVCAAAVGSLGIQVDQLYTSVCRAVTTAVSGAPGC